MPRKICGCGCNEWFSGRTRQIYKNRAHWPPPTTEQRRAWGAKGGTASGPTKGRKALQRLAVEFGGPLTAREVQIYQRGRYNGFQAGHRTGSEMGYRKGWADACGERKSA